MINSHFLYAEATWYSTLSDFICALCAAHVLSSQQAGRSRDYE